LAVDSYTLRAQIIGEVTPNKPIIVLLHGGLDCIEMWKNFPVQLATSTGLAVVVYERFGHGKSGQLTALRERDYRHHEAEVVLPKVLNTLGLEKVILVGHSDGGVMALIAASFLADQVLAVCAISPPLVIDKVVREGIEEAVKQYEKGSLARRLKVFHSDATDALFYGWAKPWLSDEFKDSSWATDIKKVGCPVSVIFGKADVYGYQSSLDELLNNLNNTPDVLLLEGVGHMPHHEAQKEVILWIKKLSNKVLQEKYITY
jgi:pimeloyl-ACP methyl ester carboxylesterase